MHALRRTPPTVPLRSPRRKRRDRTMHAEMLMMAAVVAGAPTTRASAQMCARRTFVRSSVRTHLRDRRPRAAASTAARGDVILLRPTALATRSYSVDWSGAPVRRQSLPPRRNAVGPSAHGASVTLQAVTVGHCAAPLRTLNHEMGRSRSRVDSTMKCRARRCLSRPFKGSKCPTPTAAIGVYDRGYSVQPVCVGFTGGASIRLSDRLVIS
jgi:hypothetical protein